MEPAQISQRKETEDFNTAANKNLMKSVKNKKESSFLRDDAKQRVAILAQMADEGGVTNSNKMISKRSEKDSFSSSLPNVKLLEELAIDK